MRRRHDRASLLKTLQAAGDVLREGEQRIGVVQATALHRSGLGLRAPVSQHTFVEWLLRTGVARQTGTKGRYEPGDRIEEVLQARPDTLYD